MSANAGTLAVIITTCCDLAEMVKTAECTLYKCYWHFLCKLYCCKLAWQGLAQVGLVVSMYLSAMALLNPLHLSALAQWELGGVQWIQSSFFA